ncbi:MULTISPECIES: hypothetical protein [Bacillota]|uniref:Alp7A family actin-like protein n=1 Tax=Bacillota TaxID=1239 RepID=UPI0039EFCF64
MNKLEIKRFNMDAGNSITASIINGSKDILELQTAIVKLSNSKAKDYITEKVAKSDLKDSILIEVNGQAYLVGKIAKSMAGNDLHINKELHSKLTSDIPYIMFLASVSVYEAEENYDSNEDTQLDIKYFSTMLPIFELKSAEKFSTVKEQMAARFQGEHEFKVLTPGCIKTIKINIEQSKCYEEGLTAKYGLQYNFDLTPNAVSGKFAGHNTVMVDIGGGTIDEVLLQIGLKPPKSRDDFQTITEVPYLGMIKDLRERLRSYFKSARELEDFIVANHTNDEYIWVDGLNGNQVNLTEVIKGALTDYTDQIMDIILNSYPRLENGQFYKFNYFGGNAPILKEFILNHLQDKFSDHIVREYHHIEPDKTARFLNLYGLEILSKQNTLAASEK